MTRTTNLPPDRATPLPVNADRHHALHDALAGLSRRSLPRADGPLGSLELRLPEPLERLFLRDKVRADLPLQRLCILLGGAFYALYLLYDALGPERYIDNIAIYVLLAIVIPVGSVFLLGSFLREPWLHMRRLATFAATANCTAILIAMTLAIRSELPVPWSLVLIQFLYNYFLLGLSWRTATALTSALTLGVPMALIYGDTPADAVVEQTFFLVVPAILGSIACYVAEQQQRLAWYRAQLLEELAERDSLTGLWNHRTFYERGGRILDHASRNRESVAVMMIDVDHFKRFNDTHGHLAGDRVLQSVAHNLEAHTRRPLDLAARLGGEEFALLLYGMNASAAERHADALREQLNADPEDPSRAVTLSIGIAIADHPSSLDSLVAQADKALYLAKEAGRDRSQRWVPG